MDAANVLPERTRRASRALASLAPPKRASTAQAPPKAKTTRKAKTPPKKAEAKLSRTIVKEKQQKIAARKASPKEQLMKQKLEALVHLTKNSNAKILLKHENAGDDEFGAYIPYGWARVSDYYQDEFFIVWQKPEKDKDDKWVWVPERGPLLRNEPVHRRDIARKYTIVPTTDGHKVVQTSNGGLTTATLVEPNEHLQVGTPWKQVA